MSERRDGRIPPSNSAAEESLLGCMMLSKDAVATALDLGVAVSDFYKPNHQHVFEAMLTIIRQGEPVDAVTVSHALSKSGLLNQVGGSEMLLQLQGATPAISNAGRYARIIQDCAVYRKLIETAAAIADIGYSAPTDVDGALIDAKSHVNRVAEVGGMSANMDGFYESLMDMPVGSKGIQVVEDLLCVGEVLTVTAGGGLGKSTLGRAIAYQAENGIHPFFARFNHRVGVSRTLIIDLETQGYNVKQSAEQITAQIAEMIGCDPREVNHPAILHRRGRLDLRKRGDRATIREALKRVRPNFVVMGPLKNLFEEGSAESYAQTALQVQDILMGLMSEFSFGLYLEAHGTRSNRAATAGSQRWDDWPDMAIGLEIADEEAPPGKDNGYNNALTDYSRNHTAGEMALRVTRNREPRNPGMIVPKLLIRSPYRGIPFTLVA